MLKIMLSLFLCAAFTKSHAQPGYHTGEQLSLRFVDSVMKIYGLRLVDGLFPVTINKKQGILKSSRTCRYGSRNFILTRFTTKAGAVQRERVIFSKRDSNNFQFFYLNFPGYHLGIGYYAYGNEIDNQTHNFPYLPYHLGAFTVFSDTGERFVVAYDETTELLPEMNNSVRICMLNKDLVPQKVIFINKQDSNVLYDIKRNLAYSFNRSFSSIYSTGFAQLFADSGNLPVKPVDLSQLQTEPFFWWYLH